MSGNSFDLLFEKFKLVSEKSLWILDENLPLNYPPVNTNIKVISNRFDVVESMRKLGFNASFSDFNFSALNSIDYQFIYYRISKEKSLTHYIINSASKLLSKDGQLILSGAKQEGIKGYLERATKLFNTVQIYKANKSNWAGIFAKASVNSVFLDDKKYTEIRPIANSDSDLIYQTKPGVFGWNKIDQGSLLLIEQLESLYHEKVPPLKILDIGCGYGFLSINCAQLFKSFITACDNNAAAVNTCQSNFDFHNINGEVIATNCTNGIDDNYDLIICNPPFHNGFGVENDLTDRFLQGAKQKLAKGGMAVFVVNLHIPLERKAKSSFTQIETIAKNQHFKVIVLAND